MFYQKTIDFLYFVHKNDSRQFFQDYHDDYLQFVVQPLQETVKELTNTMLYIDKDMIVEPKIGKTISRLNRDIRYSPNKSLYRDHMWLYFQRSGVYNPPQFYFDIGSTGFSYGLGYWMLDSKALQNYRKLVLNHDPIFIKAKECFESQTTFTKKGDKLKKPLSESEPLDILDWLQHKEIYFSYESDDIKEFLADDLIEKVKKDFLSIKPIYDFLIKISLG